MNPPPTGGYSIRLRLRLANKPGVLGLVTSTIGTVGGSIGAVDIVEAAFDELVRNITVDRGKCRKWSRCRRRRMRLRIATIAWENRLRGGNAHP